MLATLDKFGRILIPKKFREHLGISNNTKMNIINMHIDYYTGCRLYTTKYQNLKL